MSSWSCGGSLSLLECGTCDRVHYECRLEVPGHDRAGLMMVKRALAEGRAVADLTHDDLPPPPAPTRPPVLDPLAACPEYRVDSPGMRAEVERRRPIVRELASWIWKMYGNGRTDPRYHHTAVYKIRENDRSWKPSEVPLGVEAVEAMLLGEPTGRDSWGSGVHIGLGSFFLDESNRTDHVLWDLDQKRPGDDAVGDMVSLTLVLRRLRVPWVASASKSGAGRHVTVWFSERIQGRHARAFAAWVAREARLKARTEIFPKHDSLARPSDDGSKVAGLQAAIPGCANFTAATGGGVILGDDWEPESSDRWVERLRAADAHRVTVEHLRAIGAYAKVDFFAAAPPRAERPPVTYDARGVAPFTSADRLWAFLEQHGVSVARDRGGRGTWTNNLNLRECPNAQAHSGGRVDGATVLFDASSGRVALKCHHAGCSDFRWRDLLMKLGYAPEAREVVDGGSVTPAPPAWRGPALEVPHAPLDLLDAGWAPPSAPAAPVPPPAPAAPPSADPWADMPPPPLPPREEDVGDITARALAELEPTAAAADPRALRRRLGAPERALLNQVAVEQHGHGTPERTRALRIADCGRGQQVRWCEAHQVVHSCPLMCGRAGACVACAGAVAADRREYVATHWPEAGWVRVDVGRSVALSDPATAYGAARRALARLKAIVRKRRIRGRRWFIGAHTVLLATLRPIDAVYVSDALKYAGVAHELLGTLSPMESADLVYDVTVEPARVLEDLLGSAVGAACVSDFPYLTESHVRRTDGGRAGAQLPWASEEELRAEKKERAREAAVARGEDPDAFDHATCPRAVALSDGSVARCGRPLQARVVVDGVEVARGRTGAPAWAANDRAFAVMAAERVHRRETSHLPAS